MSRTKQRRIEHWTRATLLTLFVGAPLAAAQEHATPSERPRAAFEGPRHSEGAVHVEDLGRRLEQLERIEAQTRHHLDPASRAALRADEGAGIIRLEGMFHPQRHIGLTQDLGGVGVDRLHP
jgi:hypothetical protein